MPRRRPISLPLDLPISRDRAYELVDVIPLRATFTRYFLEHKGRKRGPYFRACFSRKGRSYAVYVGGEDHKRELEAAHALVRAELEAEAASLDASIGDLIDRHVRLYGDQGLALANLKRTAPARAPNAAGARLEKHPSEAPKLREEVSSR